VSPWKIEDVQAHNKGPDGNGLSAKAKRQWVAVANGALSSCVADGGDQKECEAKAIRMANGVVAKAQESFVSTTTYAEGIDGVTATVTWPGGEWVFTESNGAREWVWFPYTEEEEDAVREAGTIKAVGEPSPEPNGEPVEEADLAEAGKRLSAAQLDKLKGAQDVIGQILEWANYSDKEKPAPEEGDEKGNAAASAPENVTKDAGDVPAKEAAATDAAIPPTERFAESASGHALSMALEEAALGTDAVPLHLDVALIRPGWGNPRDGHYYPADVLKRDASVFIGSKMYESDHKQSEKSTRTWVSTVTGITGYTDDGAPIARVSVHSADFAQRLQALNADGLLEKMECSILATGKANPGNIGGKKGRIVESITSADSVDWVSRAGAGGRALNLAETDSQEAAETNSAPAAETVAETVSPMPILSTTDTRARCHRARPRTGRPFVRGRHCYGSGQVPPTRRIEG
jgi:hypothetical protein